MTVDNSIQNKQKTVVYITDTNYAMPTCISIVSLLKHKKKRDVYKIYIIDIGLTASQIEKFLVLEQNNVYISVINGSIDRYREYQSDCEDLGTHVSITALYKFEIERIINEDKALYLDGDVIINKDISELFTIDLSDNYVAAVDDMGDEFDEKGNSNLASRIGMKGRYFNSGVMLLNLKNIRQDGIRDKLVEYRENGKNYFVDQDAFNYVLGTKRVTIGCEYNFMGKMFDEIGFETTNERFFHGRYDDIPHCINDQKILHMTYRYKPWKYHVGWSTDIFKKYYDKSPYKDEPLMLESGIKAVTEFKDKQQRMISRYFNTMNKWMELRNRGKTLLRHEMIAGKAVAVYGMGKLGRRCVEEFMMNGKAIAYAVDKTYTDPNAAYKIYGTMGKLPHADVMIVTITDEFENIKKEVEKIFDGGIVSLEAVVDDLWTEHCDVE